MDTLDFAPSSSTSGELKESEIGDEKAGNEKDGAAERKSEGNGGETADGKDANLLCSERLSGSSVKSMFCNEKLTESSSQKTEIRSWKLSDLDEFLSDSESERTILATPSYKSPDKTDKRNNFGDKKGKESLGEVLVPDSQPPTKLAGTCI